MWHSEVESIQKSRNVRLSYKQIVYLYTYIYIYYCKYYIYIRVYIYILLQIVYVYTCIYRYTICLFRQFCILLPWQRPTKLQLPHGNQSVSSIYLNHYFFGSKQSRLLYVINRRIITCFVLNRKTDWWAESRETNQLSSEPQCKYDILP